MSLIADALKKAESSPGYRHKDVLPSFTPKNRPPQPPAWAYRLLLAASAVLVLLALARVSRRPEPPAHLDPVPAPATQEVPAAPVAPATPVPAAPEPPAPQPPAPAAVSPSPFASPVAGKQLIARAQRLSLNGIMLSGDGRPLALINQEVLQPGDRVRGMTVVQVKMDSVILQDKRGKTKILKLKKGN